jgi:hypothetical protein
MAANPCRDCGHDETEHELVQIPGEPNWRAGCRREDCECRGFRGDEIMAREERIAAVLNAADRGDVGISYGPWDHGDRFCADLEYKLSNGWTVVVFNDCGDWDYIDSVITDTGERFEFRLVEHWCNWQPSNPERWGWRRTTFSGWECVP